MNDKLKAAIAETDRIAKKLTDGGPAFPCPVKVAIDNGLGSTIGIGIMQSDPGMTLRDYFAAKALEGMLANGLGRESQNAPTGFAEVAFLYADAMIRHRNNLP